MWLSPRSGPGSGRLVLFLPGTGGYPQEYRKLLSAAAIAGASLVGVPMTAGFISKWNLLQASLSAGLWPVAAVIVLSSLLAVVYVWRVVEAGFFRAPGAKAAQATEAPLSMLVPLWVLALANLYFGIQTDLTWGLAMQAAIQLLAGT